MCISVNEKSISVNGNAHTFRDRLYRQNFYKCRSQLKAIFFKKQAKSVKTEYFA